MSAMGQELCPLCCEPLDATERAIRFCPCGFSLCRFCWKKLMETDSGRCPNCRVAYDESKLEMPHVKADDLMDDSAKKRKKKGERKKGIKLTSQERRNLQELRILQKNLVYAVGLSLDICIESVLAQNEFFGQFGPIKKISVNRSSPYSSGQSRNGPTGAAYVTFVNDEDAAKCVSTIDGTAWDGHYIRACFGTTKYCQAFLKGAQCNNPDCLYMHYLVNEGTFTKDEMNSGFSKGKPEFYHLINFDRSKGPVPGSLAKPPKGPGSMNRRDSQVQSAANIDDQKARQTQEQDWPQLTYKSRNNLDGSRGDAMNGDYEKSLTLKSSESSWTSTLKNTASGSPTAPSPFQSVSSGNLEKKVAVLSSPGQVKMVTARSARGALASQTDPSFGYSAAEEKLRPMLSTESNLSHVSFRSDGQQSTESNISGLYVPPLAAAESRLRATKSAAPLKEDLAKETTSIEEMLRRRISVPERTIDEASVLLPTASGRRGPPPGFNKLQTRVSAQAAAERAAASDLLLQKRLSYEVATDAIQRQAANGTIFGHLTQNMLAAQPSANLTANFMGSQNHTSEIGMQSQVFDGNMESPFGGPPEPQNTGPTTIESFLGINADMDNDLLKSLIASSGLAMYPLQGKNSTQLSGRGSVPTIQTRLSADAIDRTNLFDMETLNKAQFADSAQIQAQALALLNIHDSGGVRGFDAAKFDTDHFVRQQEMCLSQNAAMGMTSNPFDDPAVLAFKKPGEQLFQMGSVSSRPSDHLRTLREQSTLPITPFDDPGIPNTTLWSSNLDANAHPFISSIATDMSQMHWVNPDTSAGMTSRGGMGMYAHLAGDQVFDASGYLHPDKVSSTRS